MQKTEEKLATLIENNIKLIYLCLTRMKMLHLQDELFDLGLIALVKGAKSYDENKGYKESTYLYQCIQNEFGHYIELQKYKGKKEAKFISFETPVGEEDMVLADVVSDKRVNIGQTVFDQIDKDILMERIDSLKPSYRYVMKHLYGLGSYKKMTIEELSKDMKMSHQNIYDKRCKALKQLIVIYQKGEIGKVKTKVIKQKSSINKKYIVVIKEDLYLSSHYYRNDCQTSDINEAYRFSAFELKLALQKLFKDKNIRIMEVFNGSVIGPLEIDITKEKVKYVRRLAG